MSPLSLINLTERRMNYEDAKEATVSREEALREIAKHDCEGAAAFLSDVGNKSEYTGAEVLDWLGY